MQDWLRISILLCVFGFFKEIRPSEPFIFEYLIGPWWNNTSEQVMQQVYPVGTYAYLAQLVIVFFITDLCRYKPLIVLMAVAGVVVWSMLIWSKTLFQLQVLEVIYGTFMATEVAYYTYIYVKVQKEHYSQVTGHTRAAILGGRCLSGIVAQLLTSLSLMNYKELNYITLTAMIFAMIWSIFLPSVKKSIYFHRTPEKELLTAREKYQSAFSLMRNHFVESFTNRYVAKWSVWWALATCGFVHVQSYMQPLWTVIHKDTSSSLHNGTVEAVLTLIGCLGALSISFIKTDWSQRGELVLSLCSILSGALLIISSQTNYILVSYVCYVVFGGLYHFVITIATSEVAKHILEDSYGLVFGLNTLVALLLQTLITLCLVTGQLGWSLPPRNQHLAYGIYHMGIAVIFIIIGVIDWLNSHADVNKTY
ncbi:hypothetical protein FQA39_LY08341 [Lamprigera yunnana]|nr:hypothetical protein FQA39_LY08341 [Lamprigera yunnana]